jgi:hypothetical protein
MPTFSMTPKTYAAAGQHVQGRFALDALIAAALLMLVACLPILLIAVAGSADPSAAASAVDGGRMLALPP